MKSYTDLEQSKKLGEILPIESADMYYYTVNGDLYKTPNVIESKDDLYVDEKSVPCWSLAALLDVLPIRLEMLRDGKWNAMISRDGEARSTVNGNPIDACYELIIKLKEMDLL